MNTKQALAQWLADDDLAAALAALSTIHAQLGRNQTEVTILQGRLARLGAEVRSGTLSRENEVVERGKIRLAIIQLVDKLPGDGAAEGNDGPPITADFSQKKRRDWKKQAAGAIGAAGLAVAVLAYLNDLGIWPASPAPPVEQPHQQPTETAPAAAPDASGTPASPKPAAPKPAAPGNKTQIIIKDRGKAGIISTGDSAVFNNVKQDF